MIVKLTVANKNMRNIRLLAVGIDFIKKICVILI